jgi:hypothetical protein
MVVVLTHTKELHEINLEWHPKVERLLWRPVFQEHKFSEASGDEVLR